MDAFLLTDEDAKDREFMEHLADALVKDQSPENLVKLEKRCGTGPRNSHSVLYRYPQ